MKASEQEVVAASFENEAVDGVADEEGAVEAVGTVEVVDVPAGRKADPAAPHSNEYCQYLTNRFYENRHLMSVVKWFYVLFLW